MQRSYALFCGTLLLFFSAGAVQAGPYDGKTPLLCSVHQLFECNHTEGCVRATPDEVLGVSHFDIDFAGKVVTRANSEGKRRSPIKRVTPLEGKIIVQGVEDGQEGVRDGAGWSISVLDPEGTMSLGAVSDGFSVVALGACAPKR